ncbi:hypothetical protein CR5_157 [Cronobacter phage CR5]|uniref:hypothetical protein n=1 Tax=Cronobacter phage CR5 TaxID=1195085 RepID=UPI0003427692|nr:hypothetical protein CR5_157 [Cronobacter phage CR5]AFO71377.1 hypothetical protein CR5_157 [Cronobacter phage CR5]
MLSSWPFTAFNETAMVIPSIVAPNIRLSNFLSSYLNTPHHNSCHKHQNMMKNTRRRTYPYSYLSNLPSKN